MLGENRLGVELNSLGGQLAVADSHHDTTPGCAELEHVRQVVLGDQRVVAADLDLLRQAAEDRAAVMLDRGGLAVDRLVPDDRPPQACTSDWCPRQTPSVGMPATGKRLTASRLMPASFGVQGPGETITRSYPRISSSSTVE